MYGFRRCFARYPSEFEADHLLGVFRRELERYENDLTAAAAIIGETPLPDGVSAAELAAWFRVGEVLMNLDEMITKG